MAESGNFGNWQDPQVPEVLLTRNSTEEDVVAQMQGVDDVLRIAQWELREFQRLCGIRDRLYGTVQWSQSPKRVTLAATQEQLVFRIKFLY